MYFYYIFEPERTEGPQHDMDHIQSNVVSGLFTEKENLVNYINNIINPLIKQYIFVDDYDFKSTSFVNFINKAKAHRLSYKYSKSKTYVEGKYEKLIKYKRTDQ